MLLGAKGAFKPTYIDAIRSERRFVFSLSTCQSNFCRSLKEIQNQACVIYDTNKWWLEHGSVTLINSDRPTDKPTDHRTRGIIEKLHFQWKFSWTAEPTYYLWNNALEGATYNPDNHVMLKSTACPVILFPISIIGIVTSWNLLSVCSLVSRLVDEWLFDWAVVGW